MKNFLAAALLLLASLASAQNLSSVSIFDLYPPPVDCDTLVVLVLQVDTVEVIDTIYSTVEITDTVFVTVIDTAIIPANVWNTKYLIVARDAYAWPPDSNAWKVEAWLYDPETKRGGSWNAKMTQFGQNGDSRIFEVDQTSMNPQRYWTGGIGAKALFQALDSIRVSKQ